MREPYECAKFLTKRFITERYGYTLKNKDEYLV